VNSVDVSRHVWTSTARITCVRRPLLLKLRETPRMWHVPETSTWHATQCDNKQKILNKTVCAKITLREFNKKLHVTLLGLQTTTMRKTSSIFGGKSYIKWLISSRFRHLMHDIINQSINWFICMPARSWIDRCIQLKLWHNKKLHRGAHWVVK